MAHDRRKADHIRINLEEDVQFPGLTNGFEGYRLIHQALPELNLTEVETGVEFLGKRLQVPLLISSMTGGTEAARAINRNLARGAQARGIAMGLGLTAYRHRAGRDRGHVSVCAIWRLTSCSSPTWARSSSTTVTPWISAAAPWR